MAKNKKTKSANAKTADSLRLQDFLDLSVLLTAFSEFDLRGTGYDQKYLQTLEKVVGAETVTDILEISRTLNSEAKGNIELQEQFIRARLLSHIKFGPIVRNIIKMWYVSTWYELPQSWRDSYGTPPNDGTFLVDTYAYPEGLLWPAVGAHPPGAKAPGYASWTEKPVIPGYPRK